MWQKSPLPAETAHGQPSLHKNPHAPFSVTYGLYSEGAFGRATSLNEGTGESHYFEGIIGCLIGG